MTVDTLQSDDPRLKTSQELSAFYPRSIALLSFIFQAGGSPAVQMLSRRSLTQSGIETLLGLPGLPKTREELEQRWQRWIETLPSQ